MPESDILKRIAQMKNVPRRATDDVFPLTASRKRAKAAKHARLEDEQDELEEGDEEEVAPKRGKALAKTQTKKVAPVQSSRQPSPPIKEHVKISKRSAQSEDSQFSQNSPTPSRSNLRPRSKSNRYVDSEDMIVSSGKEYVADEDDESSESDTSVQHKKAKNAKNAKNTKKQTPKAKKGRRLQNVYPVKKTLNKQGKQPGRIRNSRWSYDEMVCLGHRVDEKYEVLYGKFGHPSGGQDDRNKAWQYVAGMLYPSYSNYHVTFNVSVPS